ncbi:hypothetical protein M422DRAFT_189971 [Sphaerobolus stellatus SS14]|uniref:DUF4218 domain-containing protein n=1 Tax=Sphaerobolus stellatus (strain SS14) TaxID=990650 RepID=A0A0C9US93_SPHS4|nr:hypothetical protein M422DRAFT_189971 [Sphaerobolus stellatus SS14]
MLHADVVSGYLLDPKAWKRVTIEEYRARAENWRDAKTLEEQEKLYTAHGVRWSPLLLLPYWNPIQLAVVDPMHALFLNLVKIHFRETYGMDSKRADKKPGRTGKRAKQTKIKPLDPKDLELGAEALKKPKLSNINPESIDVEPLNESSPTSSMVHCIDAKTLLAIRKGISDTISPSWFPVVPRQFGSAKAGKLKAAEWQAIITLYAPITLCRLWGRNGEAHSTHFKYLQNTMNLVAAVLLAVSYETSPNHAAAYTQYMQAYLHGLKELFPNFKFRDTHHIVLHIEELLNSLGPVHSWWMFPFERIIGRLQKISTNWIIGTKYIDCSLYNN